MAVTGRRNWGVHGMTEYSRQARQTELDYSAPGRAGEGAKGVWDSKDRRQYRRHQVKADAVLIANGRAHDCVIEDLAAGGLRVSVDAELPVHTLVKFEDSDAGTLKGKVLRTSSGCAIIKISADTNSAAYIVDLICREVGDKQHQSTP